MNPFFAATIKHAEANWVPLARGPFTFRRGLSFNPRLKSIYPEGTPDEELFRMVESIGNDSFRYDPEIGALVFISNDDEEGLIVRLYPDKLSEITADDLTGDDDDRRAEVAEAIRRVWSDMTFEFKMAIRANDCEIYGRIGDRASAFSHIPERAFYSCKIDRWGSTLGGGGDITLEDGTSVYSVHVAPVTPQPPPTRRGRPPNVEWGLVKTRVFELLNHHGWPHKGDPECSSAADIERAVTEYVEQELGSTAAPSTIREHTKKFMEQWRVQRAGN
jgi:hypothetical protein